MWWGDIIGGLCCCCCWCECSETGEHCPRWEETTRSLGMWGSWWGWCSYPPWPGWPPGWPPTGSTPSSGYSPMLGGVILFSFCLLLQNQTLTTSFSSWRLSARLVISCAEGFGFLLKCCSRAPLIETSMLVRFFRFRPWAAIRKIRKGKKCHNTILRKHLFFRNTWY